MNIIPEYLYFIKYVLREFIYICGGDNLAKHDFGIIDSLIPPESLKQFREIIIKANSYYQSQELQLLIKKVSNAISENKYLIHYGI